MAAARPANVLRAVPATLLKILLKNAAEYEGAKDSIAASACGVFRKA
jgi:hypothetical protein